MTEDKNGLLRGHDLDELRRKITREPFKRAFERIVTRVLEVAEEDRQTDEIPNRGWCHSKYFTPLVLEAGFVYASHDPFEGSLERFPRNLPPQFV